MIDYKNLNDSIVYYDACGYKRLELPWTVSKDVAKMTMPHDKMMSVIEHSGRVLPGSAEQCFLHQYMQGRLPLGKFQSVTPCFRDEIVDELHQKQFMKNELIITDDVSEINLMQMIECAKLFMALSLKIDVENLHVNKSNGFELSYDIEYRGAGIYNIELGSYGIRECHFVKWIYGTGCAEPRMSYVRKQIEFEKTL